MSNSPLANFTKISPNKTVPRNHTIDTITIHCVGGDCTVETIGNIFGPVSRQASSNYGIGSDGRIGLYCDEKDRSWCTSSAANDHRAVTIEVANDGGAPDWHVSDAAMDSLIKLAADICRRNGIKQLLWKGDKSLVGRIEKQNMTVHRWFSNKSCPGDYLYDKHAYIADEVNKLLGTVPSVEIFEPYIIRINTIALNVRKGPSTNHPVTKVLINDKNLYTIVEEADGLGASRWGKLKSGLGWISLDYTLKT